MDNVGDWLYIVFLIIAAVSGLFSSKDKKKKSRPDILGQPDREIVPNDQPTEGKGFWEILEDMQKETQKPKPAPRQKQVKSKVEKPQVVTSSPASSPFLSAEKNIPNHIATQPSVRMSAIEEEPGLMPEDTFRDIEELKKAIICAEILTGSINLRHTYIRFSVILCKFAPEILNSKYLPKNIKTNYHGIKIYYS